MRNRVYHVSCEPLRIFWNDDTTCSTRVPRVLSTTGWKSRNPARSRQHAWFSCRAGCIVISENPQGLATHMVHIFSEPTPLANDKIGCVRWEIPFFFLLTIDALERARLHDIQFSTYLDRWFLGEVSRDELSWTTPIDRRVLLATCAFPRCGRNDITFFLKKRRMRMIGILRYAERQTQKRTQIFWNVAISSSLI